MGMQTTTQMGIGAYGFQIQEAIGEGLIFDFYEWAESTEKFGSISVLRSSLADSLTNAFFGFKIESICTAEMDEDWLKEIEVKSKQFYDITGVNPWLMGISIE